MKKVIVATSIIAMMLVLLGQGGQLLVHWLPAAEAATTISDLQLAEHWAPVWYQDLDATDPDRDYITSFDFDGNWDGTDNWENQESKDLEAYVYYWVTETETHWFIGYAVFHPRHWDATPYENDMGGCLLMVEKDGTDYGQLSLMLTTGEPDGTHPNYYSYTPSGSDITTDYYDIDGDITMQTTSAPLVYLETKGHGVYGHEPVGFEPDNNGTYDETAVKYYRGENAEEPEPGDDMCKYELVSIDEMDREIKGFWDKRYASDPPAGYSVFPDTFHEFGTFKGDDDGLGHTTNAARAPWGWDDASLIDKVYKSDFFMDPAHLVDEYHDNLGAFSKIYIYRSYGGIAESSHPYADNFDRKWWWKVEGAQQIRVHFQKIYTGGSSDIVRIYDGTGSQLGGDVYGSHGDYWSEWATGDTIGIRLDTNHTSTYWGFYADSVQASPDLRTPVVPIDLGDVVLGINQDMTTTLYNDGIDTLAVSDISMASGSSEFSIVGSSAPFNIAAGGSETITVRFTPTSEGTKNASFTISSNDAAEPSVSFSVSGNGLNHSPDTPSNVSPVEGSIEANLTSTLQSSSFNDPDSGHTHSATQWQVSATLGNYSSPVYDSGTDTANLSQITVPSGDLSYDTTYYWHVSYQDSYGKWSDYSAETSFIIPSPPAPPTNDSPPDGATGESLTPTLESSSFSDPNPADTHAATQWQITTTAGDYTSPAYDSGTDTANLTQITVPAGELSYDIAYYWHTSYQDNHGTWSTAWSPETSFTILSVPNTPSNVSPGNGDTVDSLTPVLQASSFSDPNPADTHAASQWQITTNAGDYSSPAYDSDTDASNLTQMTVPSGELSYDTTYYWHVRYSDNHGTWSEWSPERSFTPEIQDIPKNGDQPDSDDDSPWAVVIIVLVVLVLLIILIAGMVIWRRRRAKNSQK